VRALTWRGTQKVSVEKTPDLRIEEPTDAIVPFPMLHLRDKGATMPVLTVARPPAHQDLATHVLPLEQGPHGYKIFQKKQDGCITVVLTP
jgi:hypothetical protein